MIGKERNVILGKRDEPSVFRLACAILDMEHGNKEAVNPRLAPNDSQISQNLINQRMRSPSIGRFRKDLSDCVWTRPEFTVQILPSQFISAFYLFVRFYEFFLIALVCPSIHFVGLSVNPLCRFLSQSNLSVSRSVDTDDPSVRWSVDASGLSTRKFCGSVGLTMSSPSASLNYLFYVLSFFYVLSM